MRSILKTQIMASRCCQSGATIPDVKDSVKVILAQLPSPTRTWSTLARESSTSYPFLSVGVFVTGRHEVTMSILLF